CTLALHDALPISALTSHFEMVRIKEAPEALNDLDLACLGHARQTTGQLADHAVFVAAQLVEIDAGLPKGNAVCGEAARFFEHGHAMQKRLRGNAAHIQAYAPQRGVTLDQNDLLAEIGRTECCRIA